MLQIHRQLSVLLLLVLSGVATVSANTLTDISYSSLPGNKVQVVLTLKEATTKPASFSTDSPARIAVDLLNTKSVLAKKTQTIGIGMARSVTAIQAGDKTRVVFNLLSAVSHDIRVEDNKVIIDINSGSEGAATVSNNKIIASKTIAMKAANNISNIDFKRGDEGKAEVIISMSNTNAVVDMRTEGKKLVLDFMSSAINDEMARNLDVSDFATPIKSIITESNGNNVRMEIETEGDYDHLAYQLNDSYILVVKPLSKEEVEKAKHEKKIFTGDRLSLNFQDIEVRSVLQLLADFTGLNMVVSDSVGGNLTLRLKNVPWDQAMDIILKTKGLAMRQTDNVMLIAPAQEINAWEKAELEAAKEILELSPLRTELIVVNYADAEDLADLVDENSGGDDGDSNQILSDRGSVTVDERTNTILIQDTADRIEEVRELFAKLDKPVRQVMIEARLISANDDYTKELGVRLGLDSTRPLSGGLLNNETLGFDGSLSGSVDGGNTGIGGVGTSDDNLLLNLGKDLAKGGGFNLVLAGLGEHLLSLELEAMQSEGLGEIISSPRVITADNTPATIQQGTQIAYPGDGDDAGITLVAAVLELTVTPQITPDDNIIMDLVVTRNAPTAVVGTGLPGIATESVTTNVLVANGDTIVLGGVFQETKTVGSERVPFFGDLPYVGFLFKVEQNVNNKSELLIFVTPKIAKKSLSLN